MQLHTSTGTEQKYAYPENLSAVLADVAERAQMYARENACGDWPPQARVTTATMTVSHSVTYVGDAQGDGGPFLVAAVAIYSVTS